MKVTLDLPQRRTDPSKGYLWVWSAEENGKEKRLSFDPERMASWEPSDERANPPRLGGGVPKWIAVILLPSSDR